MFVSGVVFIAGQIHFIRSQSTELILFNSSLLSLYYSASTNVMEGLTSPSPDDGPSTSSEGSPALVIIHEKRDMSQDIPKLVEMFPTTSLQQLEFVYELSCKNVDCACERLLEGPTLECLQSLAFKHDLFIPLSESPHIILDVDDEPEDWVHSAVSFYKSEKFNRNAQLRVSIRKQPGIDTGGIRRQFFYIVFRELAVSQSFPLFEGQSDRLRPSFRASSLSSGMLVTLGTMIAHSFILDGQGFPYLSEYCYYYLCGQRDKALTCISESDVGERIQTT